MMLQKICAKEILEIRWAVSCRPYSARGIQPTML